MKEDFIILNGDDLFKYTVMQGLLKTKHHISMVIDRKQDYSKDDSA